MSAQAAEPVDLLSIRPITQRHQQQDVVTLYGIFRSSNAPRTFLSSIRRRQHLVRQLHHFAGCAPTQQQTQSRTAQLPPKHRGAEAREE